MQACAELGDCPRKYWAGETLAETPYHYRVHAQMHAHTDTHKGNLEALIRLNCMAVDIHTNSGITCKLLTHTQSQGAN